MPVTKTLASVGQSKYTSGYTLGSTGNLTNTGVTLINNGTVGATAVQWGVEIYGTGNTVINYGFVTPAASSYPAAGVVFASGSNNVLINKLGGTLSSSKNGGGFYSGSNPAGRAPNSTVINSGLILATGASKVAALFEDSGILTNLSTGTVTGNGVEFYSGYGSATATSNVSVVNSGLILGGSEYGAIYMRNGGNVTNLAGTISGNGNGLYGIKIANRNALNTASTITNAGTIAGGTGANAIIMAALAGNRVVDQFGGVFIGTVDGGSSATMELASSASAGVLSATSNQFSHFSNLIIDSGARWTIKGDSGLATEFQTIGGFTVGDTISLSGLSQTPTKFTSSTVNVSGTIHTNVTIQAGATALETLNLIGNFAASDFSFVPGVTSTLGGTLCYLLGTHILTPTGEVPVEQLKIGDTVVTRWQGIQPIKWIGRQSYDSRFARNNRAKVPVRIKAGALGNRLPARDLLVSPGHSLLVDETLVLASALVNGISITQDDFPDVIRYFQIDLGAHDCVIAEGAWAETFADCEGLREAFHNVADYYELYPAYRSPEELVLCAPRPERGAKLDAVLRPVVARAASGIDHGPLRGSIDWITEARKIEGWAQDQAHPELPVLLEILLEGEPIGTVLACDYRADLLDAGLGQGRCSFALALPAGSRPEGMRTLAIRRAADGAGIPMSARLRTRLPETPAVDEVPRLRLTA